MSEPTDSVQHKQMMCRVHRLEYDFPNHAGKLFMMAGNCTDMGGCIALFCDIDPDVRLIQTFAGSVEDTKYVRSRGGRWESVLRGSRMKA